MILRTPPTDDEFRTAIADSVSDSAVVAMFIAGLQADLNDDAVYGWMAEQLQSGVIFGAEGTA